MTDVLGPLGYALLLSAPVAVGVVLAFGQTTGRLSALAVGMGIGLGLVIFVLVLLGARGPADGESDP